jgi:hypothetical protein
MVKAGLAPTIAILTALAVTEARAMGISERGLNSNKRSSTASKTAAIGYGMRLSFVRICSMASGIPCPRIALEPQRHEADNQGSAIRLISQRGCHVRLEARKKWI